MAGYPYALGLEAPKALGVYARRSAARSTAGWLNATQVRLTTDRNKANRTGPPTGEPDASVSGRTKNEEL
jgi:hypothetical protein